MMMQVHVMVMEVLVMMVEVQLRQSAATTIVMQVPQLYRYRPRRYPCGIWKRCVEVCLRLPLAEGQERPGVKAASVLGRTFS